jgi:transcriptional regulator with XRE-family HTH domain
MTKKVIPKHHQKRLDEISSYLRELRFSNGLTQQELSHNLKLHRNTIQRVENGKNTTLLTIFELADALDIGISEFLQICE